LTAKPWFAVTISANQTSQFIIRLKVGTIDQIGISCLSDPNKWKVTAMARRVSLISHHISVFINFNSNHQPEFSWYVVCVCEIIASPFEWDMSQVTRDHLFAFNDKVPRLQMCVDNDSLHSNQVGIAFVVSELEELQTTKRWFGTPHLG
jgi:hypothetical protein